MGREKMSTQKYDKKTNSQTLNSAPLELLGHKRANEEHL